jgi:hypothetical protein
MTKCENRIPERGGFLLTLAELQFVANDSCRRTTVSLSLKEVTTDPVYKQNGASPKTEAAAQVAHEGEHGVQQQDHGMPQNKAQEKAGEVDSYTVQSYVNKGLQDNSEYGIWTIRGGFNPAAVNNYAKASTAAWCQTKYQQKQDQQ